MKDVLIPISIIIAGMFIGGGLYFGGGAGGGTVTPPAAVAPQPVDNTNKVTPVVAEDHTKGNPDASIKIVEFSDFDCPFCARFHDTMNEIIAKDGDVVWAYRHFPIEQLHPQAAAVSMASECVAELGGNDAFWKFTDSYYEARGSGDATIHNELIPRLVATTGVDEQTFIACYESGRHNDAIQTDMNNAVETGGRGTPWSILIGPSGKTYPINGAIPQSAIEQLIKVARDEA